MNTEKLSNEAQTPALNKGDVTTSFSFIGWADENCHNPKKNGEYLCLVKWHNSSEYQYAVLEYDRKTKWQVTDSCEHILWCELPPSPFS